MLIWSKNMYMHVGIYATQSTSAAFTAVPQLPPTIIGASIRTFFIFPRIHFSTLQDEMKYFPLYTSPYTFHIQGGPLEVQYS